jgi:hypothetical protein
MMHWNCTGSEGRKMRGDTRIFGAVDELGWMISDESKKDMLMMNADAVYTALSNSLTTMRTKYRQVWNEDTFDVPPIIMANISSPSAAKDKIMRLYKDSLKNPRILGLNIPSWEMNPDFTYESLREEFSHKSDEEFNRDFGAEPPLATNPFISEPKLIDKIAQGEKAFAGFTVTPVVEKDSMDDSYITARFNILRGDKILPRMVAFDLGARKNCLAACVFSLSPEGKPKLDFAVNLQPEKHCRINVAKFFDDFTIPLVENFKIKHAFFDRWQSLDQVERLKAMGVDAKIHSLKYSEMDSVRGSIVSQSIIIPGLARPMTEYVKEYLESDKHFTDSPAANLGIQLLTVRDSGHRFSKPLLGDDDIFRAFCLGIVKMSDPAIKKDYLESAELSTGHRVAHLGTVRSLAMIRNNGGASSAGYGGIGTMECDDGRAMGTIKTRGTFRR